MRRKVIFSDPGKARAMVDKLARHRPGRRFEIYPLSTTQHQVVEITQCPSAMPPRIPLPIGAAAMALTAPPPVKPVELVTVRAPLFETSRAFVVIKAESRVHCFGRSTLVSLDIADGWAEFTLAKKALEKRGLMALAA